MNNYLENYIIAEQKEQYRISQYWHIYILRGLFAARSRDNAIVLSDWGIIE